MNTLDPRSSVSRRSSESDILHLADRVGRLDSSVSGR